MKSSFSTNYISIFKRGNLYAYFIPYTNLNSSWMKILNIRVNIIKLLVEKIGVNLCNFELSHGFSDVTQKKNTSKEIKIDTNEFCASKDTIRKVKK